MKDLINIGVFGFLVGGLGIPIGGLFVLVLRRIYAHTVPVIVAISVGITSCILLLDILPLSADVDGWFTSLLGLIVGFLFLFFINKWLHKGNTHRTFQEGSDYEKSAFIISFAIMIHNLPVGITLGSSLAHDSSVTWGLSTALMVHTIPEGIALALPILLGGGGFIRVLFYAVLVALPTGIGTMIGFSMGNVYEAFFAVMLALSVGTILYVSFAEVLRPAIRDIGLGKGTLGLLYGWCIGLLFLFGSHATHM